MIHGDTRIRHCHVKAMINNTTALSYINNMWLGPTEGSQISCDLCMWCTGQGIWVTAVHITGKQNVLVDKASREKHCDAEWKLDPLLFLQLTTY